MGTTLQEVFGSDLGGSEDDLGILDSVPEPVPLAEPKDKSKRQPITFSESDEEPQPEKKPSKRRREEPADDPSDDEVPRVKQPDTFSSDDEDARERSREIQKRKKRKKREQRKKKPRSDDEYDEGDASDIRPKPKIEDEEEQPPKPEKPKTAFDKAVEDNKALRRPRRKELDPKKVEDDCVRFLNKMMQARDEDVLANEKGKPALAKLRMLREVELMCMKVTHLEVLLDNMLLAIMKSWLEPTLDGSLPNLQVRQTLVDILLSIPVDSDWVERLESSQGLGRVVHFLSVREPHEPVKRNAEKLMRKWARPVYQTNANYHDLLEEFDRPNDGHRAPKEGIASERRAARETISRMKTTQEKLEEFSSHSGKKREQILATVPKAPVFLYSTLAASEVPVDPKAMRDRSSKSKMKRHDNTILRLRKRNKSMNARAAKPSINGRDD